MQQYVQKDAHGMENSVDPDQTAPWSSLIRVCTVCLHLSVPFVRTFMVSPFTLTQITRLKYAYLVAAEEAVPKRIDG